MDKMQNKTENLLERCKCFAGTVSAGAQNLLGVMDSVALEEDLFCAWDIYLGGPLSLVSSGRTLARRPF